MPAQNIRVLATEATRVALNSNEFIAAIKAETGWTVELLPKAEEGRIGAIGIASSFPSVAGLVMDLGGGSTQMSWLSSINGEVSVSESGAVSLPYGAAAVLRRLTEAQSRGSAAVNDFANEIQSNLRDAFATVTASVQSSQVAKPFNLHLSGGGFRGYGSVLMDSSPSSPYPIPIINGFSVPANIFQNTSAVSLHVETATSTDDDIFRVSTRRAAQIPAVTFLISCLTSVIPSISRVRFCQGGVREGALFASLAPDVRGQVPLTVATLPYSLTSSATTPTALNLLTASLPPPHPTAQVHAPQLITSILPALANLLTYFSPLAKDVRAATALRCTTSGILAGTHGLLHEERAALAIALCELNGGAGDLSRGDREFYGRMTKVLEPREVWWAMFVGRVAAVLCGAWPAGVGERERVSVKSAWVGEGLEIVVSVGQDVGVGGEVVNLEKLGKKKNWIGGKEGWGIKVEVKIKQC